MAGAERRSLKKVRTLVVALLDAMTEVVTQHCATQGSQTQTGAGAGLVLALGVCQASVQQPDLLGDEALAGALHLALSPFKAVHDDSKAFVKALVDVATQPLVAFVGEGEVRVLEQVCNEPANQDSLLKWARKLLKATEATLATTPAAKERERENERQRQQNKES